MRESTIEKRLKRGIEALGGLCEKFTSPGTRGVPDRLIMLPGGRIIFVETKAPKKVPNPLQAKDHERRRKLGCDVRVIDTVEKVDEFLKEIAKWC
jgi:hypothetical protein